MGRKQASRGRRLPELKRYRDRKAWTQEQLAETAGVAVGTVSRLEAGNLGAYARTVSRLSEALGVTPAQLYGEEG